MLDVRRGLVDGGHGLPAGMPGRDAQAARLRRDRLTGRRPEPSPTQHTERWIAGQPAQRSHPPTGHPLPDLPRDGIREGVQDLVFLRPLNLYDLPIGFLGLQALPAEQVCQVLVSQPYPDKTSGMEGAEAAGALGIVSGRYLSVALGADPCRFPLGSSPLAGFSPPTWCHCFQLHRV